MTTRTARVHSRLRQAARSEREPQIGSKALRLILRDVLFDGGDLPDWRRSAACAAPDVDASVFYPPSGADAVWTAAAAKRVCAECPVRRVCLADALSWETTRTRFGVLGGLTPAERGELAAALRLPGPVAVSA